MPTLFERMSAMARAAERNRAIMFHIIEDAVAIIRKPKGVYQQVKVYQRQGRVYLGAAGGFIRVTAKFGETWGTSHPDYKVLELVGSGIEFGRNGMAEPTYNA